MKKLQAEKGFTIVELLIVIVIIGILAAIVIVAYTGITQQANATAAKSNAQGVVKVAEAYNAECPTTGCTAGSGFPTLANLTAYSTTANVTAKLPSGITVVGTTLSSTHANGKTIQYIPLGTTGACVGYWDQKANAAAYLYSGSANTGTNGATPTCA